MSAYWLEKNFKESLELPTQAIEWLLALWRVTQVFDDVADGDSVSRDDLLGSVVDALVTLPTNSFYTANHATLDPLVAVAILKWKASDELERTGSASAMSFAWRAGYYDIVLAVVQIVHGMTVAMAVCASVANLYGEDFEDYLKEFENA